MIAVIIEETGTRKAVEEPEDAIAAGRRLLEQARRAGVRVPHASFIGPDGTLVRAGVTRTDLARELGVCWCGRGALRIKDGVPFCCSKHEVLWDEWDNNLRARTIVARFIAIYGRNATSWGEKKGGSTRARSASSSASAASTPRTGSTGRQSPQQKKQRKPSAPKTSSSKSAASTATRRTSHRRAGPLKRPMTSDHVRRIAGALDEQERPRMARTIAHSAGVPIRETLAILEQMETAGKARRNRGAWSKT